MPDYNFYGFFTAAKVGKAGITVTSDVRDEAGTLVANNQAATEVGGGLFRYRLTTATEGDYTAVFKTADTTVDAQHVASLAGIEGPRIDAAISTRATPADVEITFTGTVAISATEAAAVASGLLALRAYNTFSQAVTSTSTDDLSAADDLWLSLKRNTAQTDDESLVFINDTGLTRLLGATYATPAHGSLTVTGSSGDWTITAEIVATAMALLGQNVGSYDAEIKYRIGTDVRILWSGAAVLTDGVVRAIS